jgi:hypothetical protein
VRQLIPCQVSNLIILQIVREPWQIVLLTLSLLGFENKKNKKLNGKIS